MMSPPGFVSFRAKVTAGSSEACYRVVFVFVFFLKKTLNNGNGEFTNYNIASENILDFVFLLKIKKKWHV